MRFLIDECLTIDLGAVAGEGGHDAQHVAHIGKAGWKDWNVARHASESDLVLVTNNAADFRRLYARALLHAGLIVIVPNVDRAAQRRLFRAGLAVLEGPDELINRVLEIGIEGEDVTLDFYGLPAGQV